jgi:hypothetical protein
LGTAAGENPAMTAPVTAEPVKERLGSCPVCESDVLADAYAVRWRGDWYHVRCAIERDERERAASERAERPHRRP